MRELMTVFFKHACRLTNSSLLAIQGSAGGWCLVRLFRGAFISVPMFVMRQWTDKKPGADENMTLIHSASEGDLSLQMLEYEKPCGHPGFLIEVFLKTDKGKDLAQIGLFGWEDLQIAIVLLQEALELGAKHLGVRPLPTVRLWEKTYYVDERLSELRNVDDIADRVLLKKAE